VGEKIFIRKLYKDYEAAKLRVQLDKRLTKVEKEREIMPLTQKLSEEERALGICWQMVAGFEAKGEKPSGGSPELDLGAEGD